MLIFLRHGETEFNSAGRWQGQIDSPLTEKGIDQAVAAAEAMAPLGIGAIVTSPLGRAMDTAGIVAGRLQLPVSTDDRLMEVGSGVCEGLTSDEIEIQWPGFIAWRSEDRWARAPEGGETYGAARERLVAFAEDFDLSRQMTSEDDAALLVVGHSRSLAILAGALLNWTDQRVVETYPANSTPLRVRNGDLTPF